MFSSSVLIYDIGSQLKLRADNGWDSTLIKSAILGEYQSIINVDYQCTAPETSGANIGFSHWEQIAREIRSVYNIYDGFVVWHPIDTLAYTASVLSFMLENLAKPIVFSGSVLPIDAARSDALTNLQSSLYIAAYRVTKLNRISEVVVCFGGKILRGNRTRAISSSSFAAFDSPNFQALGKIGKTFDIKENILRTVPKDDSFLSVNDNLCNNVIILVLSLGLNAEKLRQIILDENIKGVVLQIFASKSLPYDPEFLDVLLNARKRGIIILSVNEGMEDEVDHGLYNASNNLTNYGVLSGLDMTPEAALAKLSVMLGKGLPFEKLRELIQYDCQGEQTNRYGYLDSLWLPKNVGESSIALINEVNAELLTFLRDHPKKMYELKPRTFEKLIAEIFRHHGYIVELTPQTRDGGHDFRSIWIDGLGMKFLSYVETKRFAPNNPVSIDIVRSLYGIVAASNVSKGIIVTSSRFTADARNFQSSLVERVSLHDYKDIKRWLKELN